MASRQIDEADFASIHVITGCTEIHGQDMKREGPIKAENNEVIME
jgi:hypothetical protein